MSPDVPPDVQSPQAALCAAIAGRRLVEMVYAGRRVQLAPHAVFRSAGGHPLVTGVTHDANDTNGDGTGFRNFDLRNVASVTVLETQFTPDPTYDPTARRFRFGLECAVATD